jgi:hypothetical protein
VTSQSPSIDTLRTTIGQMEARLGANNRLIVTELMGHYWALVARFEIDLADERDRLLSRGGALMLIQAAELGDADEP